MVLQTKKIERDWILITYDVSTEINDERDRFRDDLKEDMGAIYQNDSVYLLPKKIHSIQQIKNFAKSYDVNIVIFGLDADLTESKSISKRYIKDLKERRIRVKDKIYVAWEKLLDTESNPKQSLTGFHNKIKEINEKFSTYKFLVSKYGNKQDEWKLESLWDDVKRVERRYQKIKEHKHKSKRRK